jgi:gas vesicle protein
VAGRDAPSFLVGALTGALVGAGLALLLAPSSGEEARDVLRMRAREAADRAREAADRARSAATEAAASATGAYERGVDMVGGMRRTIDDAVEEGRAAAAEQRAALEALQPEPLEPE